MSFHLPFFHRRAIFFIALSAAGLFTVFRALVFGDMEPRSDQAFFAAWVQDLGGAEHFLPQPQRGESWFSAFLNDTHSYLNRLLRPIYNKPTSVFTLGSLAIMRITAWPFGDAYQIQVLVGIAFSGLTVFVLALAPKWAIGGSSPHKTIDFQSSGIIFALFGACFAGGAYSLHIFSPFGIHNVGVAGLIVAVAVSANRIPQILSGGPDAIERRDWVWLGLAHLFAIYGHWTNIFILPPAVVLVIMCHHEELGARLRWAVLYSLFVAGVIAPIYPIIIVEFFRPEFSREHSLGTLAVAGYNNGISEFFLMVLVRAGEWIERGATLFSLPGLAMGVVGLILMARRQTLYLPLAIAIVHFGVSILMPTFAGAYLRTNQYLMPFLVLGAAYLGWYLFNVSQGRHNKHLIRYVGLVVVAISATWHFFTQTQVLTDVRLLAERSPAAWDMYYQGQRQLRPVISDIQTLMPREAILISWGYGPQFLYTNLF